MKIKALWFILILLVILSIISIILAINKPFGNSYPQVQVVSQPVDYGKINSQIQADISQLPIQPGPRGEPGKDGRNGVDGKAGVAGAQIELRCSGGILEWKYSNTHNWSNLITLGSSC